MDGIVAKTWVNQHGTLGEPVQGALIRRVCCKGFTIVRA
jgi:hypothetical protein